MSTLLGQSIGQCIAKRRLAAGLTQDQVAERLEIGMEAVSRMERGLTIPTVVRLAELAEIFGCGVDALVIETSDRGSDQAEHIATLLSGLSKKDRAMVVDVVERICEGVRGRK
jgi:transcriptional regulator with XRE-family HTH domain